MSDATMAGALEENVLTMLVWSDQHAPTIAGNIEGGLFSTDMRIKFAQAAITYVTQYKRAPQAHIRDLLESEFRGSAQRPYEDLYQAMAQLYPTIQAAFVIDQLDKFVRIRYRLQAIEQAQHELNEGNEIAADELLWRSTPPRADFTPGLWLHDNDLSFLDNSKNTEFTSGIPTLDERGTRPARGTMTLFIAKKKFGKSFYCVHIGKHNMSRGHRVLHITLENSAALTKRRYAQALWSLPKRDGEPPRAVRFNKPTHEVEGAHYEAGLNGEGVITFDRRGKSLESIDRAILRRKFDQLRRRSPLLIKEFPTSALTVGQLNNFLDRLERDFKYTPDLLIIDYPDLMHMGRPENLRIDTGNLYRTLRGIAVERNLALFCPTQGNRRSDDAETVRSRMVAEDWSKIGTADIVLTGSATPEERQRGLARILVDAARDDIDQYVVMITQSYAIGQFCLESRLHAPVQQDAPPRRRGRVRQTAEADAEEEDA